MLGGTIYLRSLVRPLKITLALGAAGLVSVATASAATKSWTVRPSPNPGGSQTSELYGVAATSPTNAWAVGYYYNGTAYQTLIEHWNGKAWTIQPSPNPVHSQAAELYGVAATSPTNAWAVGYYYNGTAYQTLIEHWNGKAWSVDPSRGPSSAHNTLWGVSATSSSDAWAVGEYIKGRATRVLIEHWNGRNWESEPGLSPSSSDNSLRGVAATSATNAWAVGYYKQHRRDRPLVEHWNGKGWTRQHSSKPSGSYITVLDGVTATSQANAWAVGYYATRGARPPLIEHWDGTAWTTQPSPNPGGANGTYLNGVAATSPANAWAVGYYYDGSVYHPLVEHWDGQAWTVQPSADPGGTNGSFLEGVAATSGRNAWTVGYYYPGPTDQDQTLIERWRP